MPETVQTTDGRTAEVITLNDIWRIMRWGGLAAIVGVGSLIVWGVNTTRDVRDNSRTISYQDSMIGGHLAARLEIQSLQQSLGTVQSDLMDVKVTAQAIAKAVGAKTGGPE